MTDDELRRIIAVKNYAFGRLVHIQGIVRRYQQHGHDAPPMIQSQLEAAEAEYKRQCFEVQTAMQDRR